MALEIILDIDDLIFDALATTTGRHLVHQLEPLPMPLLPRIRGADVKSLAMSCILPGISLLVYFTMLSPMVQDLQAVYSEPCQWITQCFCGDGIPESVVEACSHIMIYNNDILYDTVLCYLYFAYHTHFALFPFLTFPFLWANPTNPRTCVEEIWVSFGAWTREGWCSSHRHRAMDGNSPIKVFT